MQNFMVVLLVLSSFRTEAIGDWRDQ